MPLSRFRSLISFVTVLLLLAGCRHSEVLPLPNTVKELARALGVSPMCADTHFAVPQYARLVSVITDSSGTQRKAISSKGAARNFRIAILLFRDQKSGSLQSLTYSLNSTKGGGSGQRFIQIQPMSYLVRSTTNDSDNFCYDLTLGHASGETNIRIDLQTSDKPFPADAP